MLKEKLSGWVGHLTRKSEEIYPKVVRYFEDGELLSAVNKAGGKVVGQGDAEGQDNLLLTSELHHRNLELLFGVKQDVCLLTTVLSRNHSLVGGSAVLLVLVLGGPPGGL